MLNSVKMLDKRFYIRPEKMTESSHLSWFNLIIIFTLRWFYLSHEHTWKAHFYGLHLEAFNLNNEAAVRAEEVIKTQYIEHGGSHRETDAHAFSSPVQPTVECATHFNSNCNRKTACNQLRKMLHGCSHRSFTIKSAWGMKNGRQ